MADLTAVEDWIGGLTAALSAGERAKLARAVATELRRSQAERIAAQVNPDGSAFTPRKRQLRRRGEIRATGPMFRKLRTARLLRTSATADAASVGYTGLLARIARVHQFGQVDSVDRRDPTAPKIRYPARELLGFTDADRQRITDLVLRHLTPQG